MDGTAARVANDRKAQWSGVPDAARDSLKFDQLVTAVVQELLAAKDAELAPAIDFLQPAGAFDSNVAAVIDHTILRSDATSDDVRKVCAEALQYGFASVCVNPVRVALVAKQLSGSKVKTCCVAGFPLGASGTQVKVAEAELAIGAGAQEIDMVINVGALKDRDYLTLKSDIQGVAEACHAGGAILKVIIEACLLENSEKVIACAIAKLAGADFVKTSTGFSKSGATAADVSLMRQVVGSEMGVKAAGGIRTLADLRAMLAAGASRIGASASVQIVEAARS